MSVNKEISREQLVEDGRQALAYLPGMINQARYYSKNHARSYRGFFVGATAMFRRVDDGLTVYHGWNHTPHRGAPKKCAEAQILEQAHLDEGIVRAGAFVVAATTLQNEIKSVVGEKIPTLPPCLPCVGLFEDSPLVDDSTLVFSVGNNVDVVQVHTVGGLRESYTDGGIVIPEMIAPAVNFDAGSYFYPKGLEAYEQAVLTDVPIENAVRLALAETTRIS